MASHSQVAHRWAQDDSDARAVRGYNMYYERNRAYASLFAEGSESQTIFSHRNHFPIASFQTLPSGERVVLFTTRGYSVSTSAYKREAIKALRGLSHRVIYCKNVDPRHVNLSEGGESFHRANIDDHLRVASEHYAKSQRRRSEGARARDLDQAQDALASARTYAEAFGLPLELPASVAETAALIQTRAAEAQAAYEAERLERQRKEVERMTALRAAQAEQFELWLCGRQTQRQSAYETDENGSVYMTRQGDNLVTSRGAEVPWSHAVKAFRFVKLCKEQGKEWRTNGKVVRVGHFTVSRIDENGNMWAGCHYFAWERMRECAERFGVFEAEASSEAVETRENAL